ncbi:hypothetical protein LIS77_24905 (plasmid) [Cytobacillus firmus]|uniref:hypothetical protein n=1 Tax=Cytobacillus firmus TaxID=1399 RepID=UPI00207961CD|nr:hypothetical protein [Cytobacillus firmus]USK41737.1 hypothetical protein LIS77_24905 [Cytobacillus firmus]
MEHQTQHNSIVPTSIQLLFNNEKLDIMKFLCLMNALSNTSNKQRKIEELLFYYSLVNFDLIYFFKGNLEEKVEVAPSSNQYFRFQTKINDILLAMSHLEFIEIKGEISNKLDELKVKLLKPGKVFFEENCTEYFRDMIDKYIIAHEEIKFSPDNAKKLKEGKY